MKTGGENYRNIVLYIPARLLNSLVQENGDWRCYL
jgi:hypothetical protein